MQHDRKPSHPETSASKALDKILSNPDANVSLEHMITMGSDALIRRAAHIHHNDRLIGILRERLMDLVGWAVYAKPESTEATEYSWAATELLCTECGLLITKESFASCFQTTIMNFEPPPPLSHQIKYWLKIVKTWANKLHVQMQMLLEETKAYFHLFKYSHWREVWDVLETLFSIEDNCILKDAQVYRTLLGMMLEDPQGSLELFKVILSQDHSIATIWNFLSQELQSILNLISSDHVPNPVSNAAISVLIECVAFQQRNDLTDDANFSSQLASFIPTLMSHLDALGRHFSDPSPQVSGSFAPRLWMERLQIFRLCSTMASIPSLISPMFSANVSKRFTVNTDYKKGFINFWVSFGYG